MRKRLFICGLTGWCMEIIFTAFHSFCRQDFKLTGNTSIWMFPIYSLAALIHPAYRLLKHFPVIIRGSIYSISFFFFEYISGSLLKKLNMCPWDYSQSKSNIKGVIRLDYAPIWFAAGLIFEAILIPKKGISSKNM